MAETTVKFLIVFCDTGYDLNLIKREAKKFFENFIKNERLPCTVNLGIIKNIDVDLIYKAGLNELEVVLEYKVMNKQLNINDQFKKIGKKWCDESKNQLHHLWLRLANRSLLENKGKQVHTDVDLREIAFGTAPSMNHFMQHYNYEIKSSSDKEISGTFFHNQRYFIVYICLNHGKNCKKPKQTYRFKVFYKAITRVIMNDDSNNDNTFSLYFVMRYIPLVFKEKKGKKDDEEEMGSGNRAQFLASDQEYQERKWERSKEFGCSCNFSFCNIEKIGRCPVFKIVIPKTRAAGIYERLIQRCFPNTYFYFSNFKRVLPNARLENFETFPINEQYFRSINDKTIISDIKFVCQYAWEAVVGRSLEIRDQVILKGILQEGPINVNHWEFLKNEIMKCVKHKDALVYALYHISDLINRHDIFKFDEAFWKLFDHYKKNPVKIDLPEGMCLVRRLVIMPSRVICLQPMEHFDNRVIREFGSENILRVSIQDDDFSKLTFAVQYHTRRAEFFEKIKNVTKGIYIGPRKYEILAASNSQLREHGFYMFAPDHHGNTATKIRSWMGDFSRIQNVAKYMARLGQCFSTSEEAVQIKLGDDDVISKNDKENLNYVFSDGCGMISTELAEEIRKAFKEKVPLKLMDELPIYDPSAYQIRFKGCKGMVAENPTLIGRKFVKRPSMEKFKCDSSNVLEIVKISAPRALFLNRPLISLLEQLGISPNVFMKLQKEMVMDMTDSLIYERKAHKMLANRTALDFPYKKLLKSGICLTEEPFFRRLLLSVYTIGMDQLRSKARIAIPPQFGRNMLGVVDETNSLEYGEVFVQYSEEVGNDVSPTHILEETVIVTKNPCMHPGDVRKLKAVKIEKLQHIKDCIVFPAKGPRPHPDEMAGSDLDGDEYVVIWLEDLKFKRENHTAMNYPANQEIKHKGSITVPDMIDFLCKYIQNDNVGVMANAYLAWADNHPKGIFSDVCASIAQKYPRALDFAKSGTTEYLSSSERPKIYPDFMEKGSTNNSYKSEKALGFLYRVIRTLEFFKSFKSECVANHTRRTELLEIKYKRASAWYAVTYMNQDKSVLSFPWVISDILCDVREKVLKSRSCVVPKSSLIQTCDEKLLIAFSQIFHKMSSNLCKCYSVLQDIVALWMKKCCLILTMRAEESFCYYCFERILDKFRDCSGKTCCSVRRSDCDCDISCSPTKLILEFFKFYTAEVVSKIGDCNQSTMCKGFLDLNLRSLALQSYATLAVTRNIDHLAKKERIEDTNWGDDCEEGDPIRVPVPKDFENVITHHMDDLRKLLVDSSGVKNIFIGGDKDRQGNWFIFVHSIGKPHQRWSLQELVMDSEITSFVKSKLKLL